MIDNFDFVKNFIQCGDDNVYLIDIVTRKKDFDTVVDRRIDVASYYITSIDELIEKKQMIINICETNFARAYIKTAPIKGLKVLEMASQALQGQIDNIKCFRDPNKVILGVCRNYQPENAIYVIDIDTIEDGYIDNVINRIDAGEGNHDWFIYQYPSKHGYHIICKPFDTDVINDLYPTTSVSPSNSMILYLPKSLD